MINKKISKVIGPVAGIVVFIISIGIMPVQAYPIETESLKNKVVLSSSENISYEIEQNGIKLKVTDIIGTKNRIKMNATITKDDGFGEDIQNHRNTELRMYMDKQESSGNGLSWSYPNDRTIQINAEEESEKGFSEKGNIRADLILGQYDFNGSLVIPVDFTESFNEYMKKDLHVNLDKYNKITKFESDAIGTRIFVSRVIDNTQYEDSYNAIEPYFIIKVGNKIYRATHIGGRGHSDDDESYTSVFEAGELTYNHIKNEDSISIIPINCTLALDEIQDKYKDNSYYERLLKEAVISNNVKYNKEVEFTDGTKGKIKVERTAGNIKIYCSSDSDIKSLIFAEGINGIFTDGTDDYSTAMFEGDKFIYKDENAENQYIVEFKDSHPEMMFETRIDIISLNSDNFNTGDEIKIK